MQKQLSINFKESNKIEFLDKDYLLSLIPHTSDTVKTIIKNHVTTNRLREDTLGNLFQAIINKIEKRNFGQFYTPKEVVDCIVNFLDIKPDSKILDPTCGCGVFLTTAYNHLKKINYNAIENIYGIDLNPTAVELTRINLFLRENMNLDSLKLIESNIRIGNSVTEDQRIDKRAFNWKSEFKEVFNNGGFDFIIGNPPYLTLKKNLGYNPNESNYRDVINGPVNAASLILAKSINFLKIDGVLAFVLPKTFLRVNSYVELRRKILKQCKVIQIIDLGGYFEDVRGEQIILFIQKTSSRDAIKKNKVVIKIFDDKNKNLDEQKTFSIPQKKIEKQQSNFLLLNNINFYKLIDEVDKISQPLRNHAEIFRGITIGPTSPFIKRAQDEIHEPIIKGRDIYKLGHSIKYYINSKAREISLSKKIKLKRKKIIIQNIFSSEAGLISALDINGYLTFDTVTNVVIKNPVLSYEYLLALFNSRLINFYLICLIFNNSKLTMHTDSPYLGEIPVVTIDNIRQDKIRDLLNKIRKTPNRTSIQKLDEEIYSIYKIQKKDQDLIEESLCSIMSPKSFI